MSEPLTPSVILLDAAAICLTMGVVVILGNMVLAGRYAGLPTWGVWLYDVTAPGRRSRYSEIEIDGCVSHPRATCGAICREASEHA